MLVGEAFGSKESAQLASGSCRTADKGISPVEGQMCNGLHVVQQPERSRGRLWKLG